MTRPRAELGAAPGDATLIDGDEERLPSRLPIVAAAVTASAALLVVLVLLTRSLEQDADAPAEREFAEAVPGITPPELATELKLEVPEAIGGSPFRGDVLVGVVVAPDGAPTSVEVVRSLDPALDAVARRAVAKARFRPARSKDAPVEGRLVVPVHFEPF